MKKISCIFLILVLLFALAPAPAAALPAPNPILRIGIYTGGDALATAPLTNSAGLGFAFGYLDGDNIFVELGTTNSAAITMAKNRTVYLKDGKYSETASADALIVGAFHDNHGAFSSREEAEAKVAELRAAGTPAFVSYANGAYFVRAGSYASSGDGVRVTGSKYCVSVVVSGTNDIIFQYDGGETSWLCVKPLAAEGEKPISKFRDLKNSSLQYYGMFEYRRFDGNNLYVVNAVDMQDYLKGVIPNEMSASWPIEALKAQAICAKSYAARNLSRHKSAGFNLCNDTHCQMYAGRKGATEVSDGAVDGLYGLYMTYGGSVCNAAYHSSNGGATENSENVWTEALAYLRGVIDPYEDLAAAYKGTWQYTYTNEMLTALLNARGISNTGVVDFYVEQYTPTGNVLSVAIVDSSGKKTVYSKEEARTKMNYTSLGFNTFSMRYTVLGGTVNLGVRSASGDSVLTDMSGVYAIGADGTVSVLPMPADIAVMSADGMTGAPTVANASGTYVVSGRGYGHNVGMSQWGAKGMAELGFDYQQILSYYFTGIVISDVSQTES